MFLLSRLLRNPNPRIRYGFAALLSAIGVGLIVWGVVGHDAVYAIRGVLELVIVAVVLGMAWRRGRRPSQQS
ncbi:MAG TPA: hypothetical protein VI138_03940 [Candidatus Dormibacteraeota bacterium]